MLGRTKAEAPRTDCSSQGQESPPESDGPSPCQEQLHFCPWLDAKPIPSPRPMELFPGQISACGSLILETTLSKHSSKSSKIQTAPLILCLAPNGAWFKDSSSLKKKSSNKMITQMEEFDTIQVAATYSCQCSISLNCSSFSRLADSHITHPIT